jgi:hypothetical protein
VYIDSVSVSGAVAMRKAKPVKRFAGSLDRHQYKQLQRIAERHRPPLSLQHVTRYALQNFPSDITKKKSVPDLIGAK